MRSGACDDGARHKRSCGERCQQGRQLARSTAPIRRRAGLAGTGRRAVHRNHAEGDGNHGKQKVRLHQGRVQIRSDSDAADDTVYEHRHEHADSRPTQSADSRTNPERSNRQKQCRDPDYPAQQSIDLFDRTMPRRDINKAFTVAVRPVVAAEAAPGEANNSARHREQANARRRYDGELAISGDVA